MFSTKDITKMALFVALTLACSAVPLPPIGFSLFRLAGLPVILSGFLLGPRAGFWVGAVSDILGFVLFPKGQMFFPGFILTQGLTGMLPALIVGRHKPNLLRYIWAIGITQGVTKLLLVPFFLAFLMVGFGEAFLVTMKVKALEGLICQLVHVPLYAWICFLILRVLDNYQNRQNVDSYPSPVTPIDKAAEPSKKNPVREAPGVADSLVESPKDSVNIYGQEYELNENGEYELLGK